MVVNNVPQSTAQDCFSGWEQYPEQLSLYNPFCQNGRQLRQRLDQQAASLFSDETELHVIDALENNQYKANAQQLQTLQEVNQHFAADFADLRIISIVRKHSLRPLKISKEALLKILQRHQIEPCFLDLLFSFRNVEELSEKGHSFWSPVKSSVASSELCYQFKYMERNSHGQGVQWSERQIGVYHRFGTAEHDVMVLLHAGLNTEVQQRLHEAFSSGSYTQTRASSPLLLHSLIIGTYLDNWRWVLDDYGTQCLDRENSGFVVSLEHQSLNFKELQNLRNLQSKLLVASTILEATKNTLEGLETAAKQLAADVLFSDANETTSGSSTSGVAVTEAPETQALHCLKLKCEGFIRSIHVIQNRADKLTKLLADALSLKSQGATIKIADSTFELTQQSVDDNAIVRVITVMTLIYLPMQGVATFFGMNLTELRESTNRIAFSEDWWLFLATSVPLTILTLAILGIASLREKRKRLERAKKKEIT